MRTTLKSALILALSVLLVATIAGCGKKITENAVEEALEEASGGDVEVDIDGDEDDGSMTITSEDGEMTIESGDGASMPDGFPDDMPLLDGDVTGSTSITTDEGSMLTVALMIDDTADEAKAFLDEELPAEGWTITFTMENNDGDVGRTVSYVLEKGERTANVTVVDDGDSVVVSYTVLAEQ